MYTFILVSHCGYSLFVLDLPYIFFSLRHRHVFNTFYLISTLMRSKNSHYPKMCTDTYPTNHQHTPSSSTTCWSKHHRLCLSFQSHFWTRVHSKSCDPVSYIGRSSRKKNVRGTYSTQWRYKSTFRCFKLSVPLSVRTILLRFHPVSHWHHPCLELDLLLHTFNK